MVMKNAHKRSWKVIENHFQYSVHSLLMALSTDIITYSIHLEQDKA